MFLSTLDIAEQMGVTVKSELINVSEFGRVGLPLFAGCEVCNETLPIQSAYPTTRGTVCCRAHVANDGFASLADFLSAKQAGRFDKVRTR